MKTRHFRQNRHFYYALACLYGGKGPCGNKKLPARAGSKSVVTIFGPDKL